MGLDPPWKDLERSSLEQTEAVPGLLKGSPLPCLPAVSDPPQLNPGSFGALPSKRVGARESVPPCKMGGAVPFFQSLDSDLSDGPITAQEYLQVKNALVASEAKIQQLLKVNVNLSDELRTMQKKVALHSTPGLPRRVAPVRPRAA